jgi:catechol 2,3-dioxygenase-like lactoylglutathione lyase family enzyme
MAPGIDGVLETALYVDDLARSAEFYGTILGFDVIDSSDRLWAMKVSPRQVLLLFRKGATSDRVLAKHDGDGRLHVAFAIPAEQQIEWESWLERHGVSIEEKRTWEFGGCSLYFRDPDQHLIELATPGVWPRVY